MRKLVTILAGAMGLIAAPASASVIPELTSVTSTPGGFEWLYEGTVATDQGLTTGDRLVIYDFAGFIEGSFINPYGPLVEATAELLTTPEGGILPVISGGFTDDPNLFNLVFTYVGTEPVNMACAPSCPELQFAGIGALSEFGTIGVDGFTGNATINQGAAAGNDAINGGSVDVPVGAIPEPATWAMMLLGFGAVGFTMRRKRRPALTQLA